MATRTFGMALGELIYQKRKKHGLTQVQLAEDAFGTSAKTRRVSELESGLVANPHPKTIDPIIAVLSISQAELEECAKQTNFAPDQELDRAYRESRNLIEAVARQFEHSNPNATLAELDEFLRAKAREWNELRNRIELIETTDETLSNLKIAATNALSDGNFDEADQLLLKAEEVQQQDQTLRQLRKHAELRITRGDINLLKGDGENALKLYLSACEFF